MKRRIAILSLLLAAPAVAQLLPTPLPGLPRVGGVLDNLRNDLGSVADLPRQAAALAQDRLDRIDALLRANRGTIARDEHGDAARADAVIVTDPDDALIAAAKAAGFALAERGEIDGLGIDFARFAAPVGGSLPEALKAMRRLAGKRDVSADQLHFQSGAVSARAAPAAIAPRAASGAIGMIDGGVSAAAGLDGTITRQGFATGAGSASDHGTAIASLLLGSGTIRGAAGGAHLYAANVYGTDPAGGNALAIAKALGWLSSQHVPVTVISLVGPANPLLARVAGAVQARGMIIVAAVGNDGPAAPPAYPASYPRVIAVTGVDGRNRALIEAGRALHLDYAAPGADMLAANATGRETAVRGTSFAAPLAAARIAALYDAHDPAAALRRADAEARRLTPASRYGRGLLCGACRTPQK